MQLSLYDSYRYHINFDQYIIQCRTNGFSPNFYSITDDSKHHKLDRHAVVIGAMDVGDKDPCFKFLTVSAGKSKDAKGNAELNKMGFENELGKDTMKHYGGNITDNADTAKKESRDTFDLLLDDSRLEHAVRPKPMSLCDPFHIENLAVTHASLAAFGQTERDSFCD